MAFKLLPEKEKPSFKEEAVESAKRLPGQIISGPLAAIPGTVGDIFKGINDLIAAPLTSLMTGSSVPYEETIVGKSLPTTKTHRERLEKGVPSLKPKNRVEKFIKDLSQDAMELYLPGKYLKMEKYGFSPLRSINFSVLSNTAGEGVYQMTGDETKADMAKGASRLVLSLWNPMGAKNVASNLYSKAESLLPTGASASTSKLNQNLSSLESQVLKNRSYDQLADSEKFLIDEINKVRQSTQSGTAPVETLQAIKRSLNETLQKTVFDIKDKSARGRAKNLAKQVNGYLQETLKDYGKSNPDWWNAYSSADKAYGAIAQSNIISRALEKYMKGRPEWLSHIFGISAPAALAYLSPMIGGGTAGAYQAVKMIMRMAKSKEMAKHYGKVAGAALSDNSKVIHKELDKIEELAEKEEPSQGKYRLLD